MTTTTSDEPKKIPETWTKEEFEGVVQFMQDKAREVYTKDGYHAPMAFVFSTLNPENGKNERSMIPVMAAQFAEDAHKDGFSAAIKMIAWATKAVGIIFISEIWLKTPTAPPGYEKMTRAELEDYLLNQTGPRPSESPDRKEALFMSAEHVRFGSFGHYASITRDADNKPTLGPWTNRGSGMVGRFVHLLPPVS